MYSSVIACVCVCARVCVCVCVTICTYGGPSLIKFQFHFIVLRQVVTRTHAFRVVSRVVCP